MCRNIRVLHHFEPPTTAEEIHAAALQYVRKVSGLPKAPKGDELAWTKAIDDIAESTRRLLTSLPPRAEARTREGEREKARVKWARRVDRVAPR